MNLNFISRYELYVFSVSMPGQKLSTFTVFLFPLYPSWTKPGGGVFQLDTIIGVDLRQYEDKPFACS